MTLNPYVLLELACVAVLVYGLTRTGKAQRWGSRLAIGAFAAAILVVVIAPETNCYIDWDGWANPEVCD